MALYRSGWRAQHHRDRKLAHQQRRSVAHRRTLRPWHWTAACGDHRRRSLGREPDPAFAGVPDERVGHPGGLSVQPTSLGEARTFIDFLINRLREDPNWVAYPLAVVGKAGRTQSQSLRRL